LAKEIEHTKLPKQNDESGSQNQYAGRQLIVIGHLNHTPSR
jgi:hypothetical protein